MNNNRRIAKRYAKAFLHDKVDKSQIDRLAVEAKAIVKALQSDVTVTNFFMNPVTPKSDKITVVGRITEKLDLSGFTRDLLTILINKDRFNIIDAVAEELQDAADCINERVRIVLTTASEPSVKEIDQIAERIGKYFKSKTVVDRKIDPAIVGGFIVEGDGKVIDMSVRGQLRRILEKV